MTRFRPAVRQVVAAVAALAGAVAFAAPAKAGDDGIDVFLNHARILKLSRPATTIVIGNPQVADATVQDASTIVLTGRAFGQTNLVILDEEGAPIIDERVMVKKDEAKTLRVYRRSNVQILSCSPNCEQAYQTEAEAEAAKATAEANRPTLF